MNKQELIEKYEYLNHDCFRRVDTSEVLKDLKQLDEPEKVTIPQSVVDWIEHFKKCSGTLYGSTAPYSYYGRAITDGFEGDVIEVLRWIRDNSEVYARAWLDGYEIEKKRRYTVVMKGTKQPLFYNNLHERLFFSLGELATRFTRKQIEDAGLGEVFNSPLFEVEEVE